MSASDQSMTTPTDLSTDSTDPQELRVLLDRALERLSYYESFDRMIGENLRRTGEMMAETVALREQAAQAVRERQAADEALQADRERYRGLIEDALAEVHNAQPVLESMMTRLQDALDELTTTDIEKDSITTAASAEPIAVRQEEPSAPVVEPAPSPEPVADDPVETSEPEAPEKEAAVAQEETRPQEDAPEEPAPDDGPKTMDVLAHGVPSAEVAIGLQNLLRGLEQVDKVEAREFADGELRLQIECTGAFPGSSLAEWLTSRNGTLTSHNGKAIELTFA